MPQLTGVIGSFSTGTYGVTRTAQGSYADGYYTPGATSAFSIDACVQPVRGRVKEVPADAQRGAEMRVVYTTTELRTRTPTNDPDRVTIDGEAWEVVRVERWQAFGDTHYRAYVARLPTP